MTPAERPVPTRERLIRSALRLFQSRGYHDVGLSELLAAADCPKGSLYHHFPGGKAALAAEVIEWLRLEMVTAFDTSRTRAVPARKQVEGLFSGTAAWVAGNGYAQGALLAVMAQELVPQDAALTRAIGQAYADARDAFARALEAGGADGALAGPVLALLDGSVAQARASLSTGPILAALAVALRLVG